MPCDYGSRHPNPISHLTEMEQDDLVFDIGTTILARKINLNNTTPPIDIDTIRQAAQSDPHYQQLMEDISKGRSEPPSGSEVNNRIYKELSVENGVIMRGGQIYVPDTPMQPGQRNLRLNLIDIAHEGHP
eukprot:TCONS_00039766-protein